MEEINRVKKKIEWTDDDRFYNRPLESTSDVYRVALLIPLRCFAKFHDEIVFSSVYQTWEARKGRTSRFKSSPNRTLELIKPFVSFTLDFSALDLLSVKTVCTIFFT